MTAEYKKACEYCARPLELGKNPANNLRIRFCGRSCRVMHWRVINGDPRKLMAGERAARRDARREMKTRPIRRLADIPTGGKG